MLSTSWPTTRRTNETICRLSDPMMVWHSPHLMTATITITPVMMTWVHSSMNPQQHLTSQPPPIHSNTVAPLSLLAVAVVAARMYTDQVGAGETRGTSSHVFTVVKLGIMPLHACTPLKTPNDTWQRLSLPEPTTTVKQPNNCLCLGLSVENKKTSTPPTNSLFPLMGPHKPAMVLTYQENGSYSTANPLSLSSATGGSSETSVNPMGGCTSIAMQGSPGQTS